MARRRTLVPPTAEELKEIEAGFARETPAGLPGTAAPIAQVAGEAAQALDPADPEARAEAARTRADAEALRTARSDGRLMLEVPLTLIHAEEMVRDRMNVDESELDELRDSILKNGQRLPVELFELTEPRENGAIYGLLSGYRRFLAIRQLHDFGLEKFATIRAVIREPGSIARAFQDMVEENEIRTGLSHFERGRIAVIAVDQGGFRSVEEAVDYLFASASKSKRSKVRSFALIHEELGDLLRFPRELAERSGLRLAAALREGQGGALREALATQPPQTAAQEWALMEPFIVAAEARPGDRSRGGRPRTGAASDAMVPDTRPRALGRDLAIRADRDGQGYMIRFEGRRADAGLVEAAIRLLEAGLDGPDE